MRSGFRRSSCLLLVLGALCCATAAPAQTPAQTPATIAPASAVGPRYLVYFDDFSAYLSPRAKKIIADAARRAKAADAKTITVQARASATGTVQTNKYLAMTRASIVADQLEADGIAASMVEQEPIGPTGSSDPTVYNRRVDIIIKR
jgi:outer membrane protein OmpA-like peptidoglycan-associated protein